MEVNAIDMAAAGICLTGEEERGSPMKSGRVKRSVFQLIRVPTTVNECAMSWSFQGQS